MSVIKPDRRTTADGFEHEGDARSDAADSGPLMLVDDDEDVRLLLGDSLRSVGYEIVEARDGVDALAMLRSGIRLPVAIVTDLAMPRLDGWGLIEAVHSDDRFAAIPIVVVSSAACPPPSIRCLCKPLKCDRLIDVLAGLGAPPPAGRAARNDIRERRDDGQ